MDSKTMFEPCEATAIALGWALGMLCMIVVASCGALVRRHRRAARKQSFRLVPDRPDRLDDDDDDAQHDLKLEAGVLPPRARGVRPDERAHRAAAAGRAAPAGRAAGRGGK